VEVGVVVRKAGSTWPGRRHTGLHGWHDKAYTDEVALQIRDEQDNQLAESPESDTG
jgi:hypothetical protein